MSESTARCPSCDKELESSFGPKTCPQCGTLVFVSFDGSVELPNPQVTELNHAAELTLPKITIPAISEPMESVPLEPPSELDLNFELDNLGSAATAAEPPAEVGMSQDIPDFSLSSHHRQSNAELDSIQTFANSEMSDGHEGDLLFDIIVEGLDTESVRRDFRDSLLDRRLQIDVDATMRSIRSGMLRMPGVSAIKASVLVHRMKELPIEVRWVQRRLIEDEGVEVPPEGELK